MKKIGILCPLFSLPNDYGIGDFSDCAYKFIDYLSLIHYSYWQILPLNPVDGFNSPYQSASSYALDELYISLEDLKKKGLIRIIKPYVGDKGRVNYNKAREYKIEYLREAYNNFIKDKKNLDLLNKFKKKQTRIREFAIYKVLNELNHLNSWNEWTIKEIDNKHLVDVDFEIFKQYILLNQWDAIHKYAKKKKVDIIGDVPFYVGFNSADVYFNKEFFLLDKKYNPTLVAGVPPDYYSEDGQLWGNPIYNWDYLKEKNFSLLFERLLNASKIYDVVRLDHFRAFDTYYTVKYGSKNARVGDWIEAPGYEFFDKLFSVKPNIRLIAEDLGEMRDEVYYLRDHYDFPGMKVIQFTFIDEELYQKESPFIYKRENSICYTSTHDSSTMLEWLDSLSKDIYHQVDEYLKRYGSNDISDNMLSYAVNQPANTVILFISDILRLNKEGKINTPGIANKINWSYRMKDFKGLEKYKKKLYELALSSRRAI